MSETKIDDSKKTDIPTKREFHQVETSTYWLPKDEDEQLRLTGQHGIFKYIAGGNVRPKVLKALDFKGGLEVLDVGCGSGVWVMDMISEYPNCSYYGCDMVDVVNKNMMPKQFQFAIGNILEGLPYPDNSFDFVHMRLFVAALKVEEWPLAIKELVRVTKPGGYFQMVELDMKIPELKEGQEKDAFYRLMEAANITCKARGQDARIGRELERMVSEADHITIIDTKYGYIDTILANGTNEAKMAIWAWIQFAKSGMPMFGPVLGLKNVQEQQNFLKELEYCMTSINGHAHVYTVAAQKVE
ncbi:hypothetical protein CU097_002455 [Rhizopus azygosporus]|uniref:Methyltransferase domain-containing protein n=2 Tax=Rhizopus TaxID=4842 RepID=A0A367JDE5_RHIAZ|nr:S-adenosyl-L-methionine-dependent methyltransferase [Rhizopus microsporus]RCH87741.1 hypothetical protein CU097_002455 [Rhizopus azygosporus]